MHLFLCANGLLVLSSCLDLVFFFFDGCKQQVRGLVKEHIDSFNYFVNKGIKKIVEANNRIEARNDPSIYLRYACQFV
jgi:hypothetical protein